VPQRVGATLFASSSPCGSSGGRERGRIKEGATSFGDGGEGSPPADRIRRWCPIESRKDLLAVSLRRHTLIKDGAPFEGHRPGRLFESIDIF